MCTLPPDPELLPKVASHRDAVYRYILSIMRDPAEADDLTQDTLLRAQTSLATLKDGAKLASWLYRIATNICYDRFRQPSFRQRGRSLDARGEEADGLGEADAPVDPSPRLDKAMEQEEMSACVQNYLTDLPDPYRAVILLHDIEGMTNPEIAEMLEVSLATVKIRLHRARNKLRAALEAGCSFSCDERGVLVCDRKGPEPEE